MADIRELNPKALWRNFYRITQVPRPSGKKDEIGRFLVDFGKSLGLETLQDEVGNVLIRKPATPGMEGRKPVILQAHMDMVPQKNSDVAHDFERDPITALVDGEWVLGGFEEEEYTVKDGDLVSLVFHFSEDGETVKGGEEITVEPSSTPNNMNIDYLYNLWLGTEDEVLLCLSGKRFKHLPAKIIDTEKEMTTFEYTVDKDGYVTKAVEKDDEDTYVYTFFYE